MANENQQATQPQRAAIVPVQLFQLMIDYILASRPGDKHSVGDVLNLIEGTKSVRVSEITEKPAAQNALEKAMEQ